MLTLFKQCKYQFIWLYTNVVEEAHSVLVSAVWRNGLTGAESDAKLPAAYPCRLLRGSSSSSSRSYSVGCDAIELAVRLRPLAADRCQCCVWRCLGSCDWQAVRDAPALSSRSYQHVDWISCMRWLLSTFPRPRELLGWYVGPWRLICILYTACPVQY